MVEETTAIEGPRVEVKTLSDRSLYFPINEEFKSIGHLKGLIIAKDDASIGSIILVHNGAILADDVLIESLPSVIQPSTQIKTTTVHWFYMEPIALTLNPIETAKDWDAKNRLRCFVGIYQLSQRNFVQASSLLTECLATFQEASFMSFKDLVKYAILAAILVLDRPELSKKILKSSEVLEVIDQLPELKALVDSFYLCNYAAFFQALGIE